MSKISKDEWRVYKNVFDQFTIKTLFQLISQGHFEGLKTPFMIGKEANIFIAEHPQGPRIVKIYRLETSNFHKMYTYIKSDPRYAQLKSQRRKVIFAWTQREFRNLLIAREAIDVPTPFAFMNNVIVMEMIGDAMPAKQLKDKVPKDPEEFFDRLINAVKKLYEQGLVHGDLSEYNILNHNETPYFFDFSQGTSIKDPQSSELLKRDLYNVCRFFSRFGYDYDENEIFDEIAQEPNF